MSYSRILIVVAGNMAAGKDTLADLLAARIPEAERDSFAAPLKDCVHLKTGIPMWVLQADATVKNDAKYGAYGKTPRKLMQEEGEEARQRIGLTVWMDRLADRFLQGCTRVLVVSDGRHPEEEMIALRERISGRALVVLVRVVRPGWPVNRDHVSESRVADAPDSLFDYKIVNDGTKEDLAAKAEILAYAIQLRAQTGKPQETAWKVVCGQKAWTMPFRSQYDAGLCATQPMVRCEVCGTHSEHEFKSVDLTSVMVK
jgi:hypothetical protein